MKLFPPHFSALAVEKKKRKEKDVLDDEEEGKVERV